MTLTAAHVRGIRARANADEQPIDKPIRTICKWAFSMEVRGNSESALDLARACESIQSWSMLQMNVTDDLCDTVDALRAENAALKAERDALIQQADREASYGMRLMEAVQPNPGESVMDAIARLKTEAQRLREALEQIKRRSIVMRDEHARDFPIGSISSFLLKELGATQVEVIDAALATPAPEQPEASTEGQ